VSDLAAYRIEVEAWRGSVIESRHVVFAAASGAGAAAPPGGVDPASLPVAFLRSAAKPFQLLPLLAAGGRERFALADADLAIMAASHDGTDAHAARVGAILERMGLGPEHLQCGSHRPYFLEALPPDHPQRLRLFGPLHDNCSGNHAGMLGLALMLGIDPGRYLDAQGTGQVRVHAVVEALCGTRPELAVDNCGAPCYALPLAAMAEGYRLLAAPEAVHGLPPARRALLETVAPPARIEDELRRTAAAMASHPEWVSGDGTPETRLSRLRPGELVLKTGAEAILCVAHRRGGAALALKVVDGSARALVPAVVSLLGGLGWLSADDRSRVADLEAPPLHGRAGRVVGRLRCAATP
jgi:L-asparaginase II